MEAKWREKKRAVKKLNLAKQKAEAIF